eukprot:COSAG02_NODE_38303_length_430_cov_1.867069_1_plen_142_part_11
MGGEDVWKLQNGTWELEKKRNYTAEWGMRNWKEVWAVLYADGELEYYENGPQRKQGEVLPSCPPETLTLRSPTGENCSVDNGRKEEPDEFIVKLPSIPGKENIRGSKTFRVKNAADRDAWKGLIMAEFGTSGTLPTWEDGSQ